MRWMFMLIALLSTSNIKVFPWVISVEMCLGKWSKLMLHLRVAAKVQHSRHTGDNRTEFQKTDTCVWRGLDVSAVLVSCEYFPAKPPSVKFRVQLSLKIISWRKIPWRGKKVLLFSFLWVAFPPGFFSLLMLALSTPPTASIFYETWCWLHSSVFPSTLAVHWASCPLWVKTEHSQLFFFLRQRMWLKSIFPSLLSCFPSFFKKKNRSCGQNLLISHPEGLYTCTVLHVCL